MAVVAPSAPKRHGFSIESLIGRRDDSPRRQTSLTNGVLSGFPRPEDFASPARDERRDGTTKDCQAKDLSLNGRNSGIGVPSEVVQDGRRSGHQPGRRGDSPAAALHHSSRDGALYDRDLLLRGGRRASGSPLLGDREQLLHGDREGSISSFRDFQRDRLFAREVEFQRDRDLAREMEFQRDRDLARDAQAAKDRASRSPIRPGTASPSSTCTEGERREGASSLSPVPLASSSPRLPPFGSGDPGPKASPPSPASPEAENRLGGGSWSPEDLKHLLHNAAAAAAAAAGGPAAFHPPGGGPPSHHHLVSHHPPHGGGMGSADSPGHAGLFQPLRMCNRSLSAAMSSLLPPQLAHLPFSPLLYSLQRDLASAAAHTHPHHPAAAAAHHPLLARYPGFMHPRYPLGPPHPGLLFHPYRKPKRNRTAFSPNQLLQLEQAFEKNHYVVGQERKSLASKLQLTETQVKVWFQNRRTKHKRMKAEEEQGTGGVTSGDEAGKTGDHSDGEHMDNKSDVMSDHELLAGEDDDVCLTDDEEELTVTEDS